MKNDVCILIVKIRKSLMNRHSSRLKTFERLAPNDEAPSRLPFTKQTLIDTTGISNIF